MFLYLQDLPFSFCIACETAHEGSYICNANTDKRNDELHYYVQEMVESKKEEKLLTDLKVLGSQLDKIIVGVKNMYEELLKFRDTSPTIRAFYDNTVTKKPRNVILSAAFDVNRLFQQKRSLPDNDYAKHKYAQLIRRQ